MIHSKTTLTAIDAAFLDAILEALFYGEHPGSMLFTPPLNPFR
jgi:hypothetical protein